MHLVHLHHSRLPVVGHGGAQRIATWLAQGLAALGHSVTVIGAPGTALPGLRCVGVDPEVVRSAGFDPRPLIPAPIDVLHHHGPVCQPPPLPYVTTLHGNREQGRQTRTPSVSARITRGVTERRRSSTTTHDTPAPTTGCGICHISGEVQPELALVWATACTSESDDGRDGRQHDRVGSQ